MCAVHMNQAPGSGTFVQIIDILRDNGQVALPPGIKPRERMMRCIGLLGLDRGAPHIIKSQHQIGIAGKGFGRRHILDAVLLPQPAASTKGINPAFRAHAGAGQDYDVANFCHLAHEAPNFRTGK